MSPHVSRSPCPPPRKPVAVAPAPAFRALFLARGAEAFFRRLGQALAALEDHWIGDLIGVVAIFWMLWLGLLFAHATGVSP